MSRRHAQGLQYVRGASLIELMIAMTIGLIISAAILGAFQGASNASRMSEAQGRMNEDAQAALAVLTQQLHMAGNNPDQANRVDNADATLSSRHNPVYLPAPAYAGYAVKPLGSTLSAFSVRGCGGSFDNLGTASDIDHLTCAPLAGTAPNSIALSYEADRFNTVPAGPAPASFATDCLGKKLTVRSATLPSVVGAGVVSTEASYAVADNRFYIDTKSGVPSLYCKGNGIDSGAQALVDNIEDLQFLFGAMKVPPAGNDTREVAGYLSSDQMLSDTDLAGLANDAARWQRVLSVRICIVVRSQSAVVSSASSAGYAKCDGSLETAPPDLRLRHAYFTTVLLRNRRL
jgi:type IV pilus assembly protein PilW